jgi:hypothetical protein
LRTVVLDHEATMTGMLRKSGIKSYSGDLANEG